MKYLPITFWVMTFGTIAITGLGIPFIDLGFAGFYSKDAIIHAAYEAGGAGHPVGYFAFTIGMTFQTSDASIFTVDGSGLITPVRRGQAVLTVTA